MPAESKTIVEKPVNYRDLIENEISEIQWHKIDKAIKSYFAHDYHTAMSVTIRRNGRLVYNEGFGGAGVVVDGNQVDYRTCTPYSPMCSFSSSKAITSMLMLKLEEIGALDLSERVCAYIPEFAQNGKGQITIEQLMAHRGGISHVPTNKVGTSILHDWDLMVKLLCHMQADDHPEHHQTYHAITGGYIQGEIAQRVTGKCLKELMDTYITKPLGARYMQYGLAPEHRDQVIPAVETGPKFQAVMTPVLKRVLGDLSVSEIVNGLNAEGAMEGKLPSANIFTSSYDVNLFYECLLNNGVSQSGQQVFAPETVAKAIQPAGRIVVDGGLPFAMRFSPAFMLGEYFPGFFGLSAPQAFGHLGLSTIMSWADPERNLSISIMNNGKTLALGALPRLFQLIWKVVRQLPADK